MIPTLVLSQALTSCGDDGGGSSGSCEPGVRKDCPVAGMDCDGEQTCKADGSGYSDCACKSTGGGNGGTSSTGNGGSSNAGSAGTGTVANQIPGGVGEPCETSADCPPTADGEALLTCIPSTSNAEFGLGGPQGGFCTLPCSSNDECQAVDAFSGCATLDGGSYCVGVCEAGQGADLLKCGGARAQACFRVSQADPVAGGCFPVCTSDAACGAGRFCDNSEAGLGLCRDMPPTGGGPIGAPCTRETEVEDCAGDACLTLSQNGVVLGGFCSAICTFLSPSGCGFDAGSTGVKDAACINSYYSTGGAGDLGFCVEVCDADADCTQAADGWVCRLFNDANAEEFVGRAGQCVPGALVTGPIDAGPG